ncbi:HAD family phosphatase [Micromonospora sp. KC721]|uniref:HAD family hydrolase n=1 Tax=Micromonospora sp. KC721 TaxID=2530380 RepID=UPI00104F6E21|nr:HAD family phosphatase [Micromonospora sp. KC721]TDB82451.1 HAD family phosphatase [Micromonospora sp. KC721]
MRHGAWEPAVRGVIFDLDGVLVDSEPNYFAAERRLLADHGVDFTVEMKRPYIGMSTREVIVDLVRRFGLPEPVDVLIERKNAHYLELASRATTVYPQTSRLLTLLHERGYPVALASGSSPEVIEVVLNAAGLRKLFNVVVSADAVPRGKPAPDLFLAAANQLGVPPEGCVVLEDSAPGVRAALAAGMRCVAVPYLPDDPLDPVYRSADLLIADGMSGFRAEEVFDWLTTRGGQGDRPHGDRPQA